MAQVASQPPQHRHRRRLDCGPQSWCRWHRSRPCIATTVTLTADSSCDAGCIAATTAVVSTAVRSCGAGGIAAAAASLPPSSWLLSTVVVQVASQPSPHRHRCRLDCGPQLWRKWHRSRRRIATAAVSTAIFSVDAQLGRKWSRRRRCVAAAAASPPPAQTRTAPRSRPPGFRLSTGARRPPSPLARCQRCVHRALGY